MKRILLIFLLIVVVFISSCKDAKTESVTNTPNNNGNDTNTSEKKSMEDIYFFRSGEQYGFLEDGKAISGSLPYKINPISKTASLVCIDPLCTHGINCPLIGGGNGIFYVFGNYFVYVYRDIDIDILTSQITNSAQLRVYDMVTGNHRKLTEYEDALYFISGTENYFYYRIAQYNEENGSAYYVNYRADIKTGNIIALGEYSSDHTGDAQFDDISMISDDKIYWNTPNNTFYTTDLDGNNKQSFNGRNAGGGFLGAFSYHSNYYNGYSYWSERFIPLLSGKDVVSIPTSPRDNNLYRIPIDAGNDGENRENERELLAEHIISYALCGDKIYYTMLEENPEPIEYNGEIVKDLITNEEEHNWSGGKIYVMNVDGTDKRLVCDTEYDFNTTFGLNSFHIEAKSINGTDYIICSFNISEEKDLSAIFPGRYYNYSASPDTLIINASTGEYTVVSVPE